MSVLVRSTYLSIFTTSVIFLVYGWWVFQVLGVGYFTGPDALVRIGKAIGVLILAGYGFEFLVQIGAVFISARLSGERDVIVDERDKQIVYRSTFISMHVLYAGIFLAIGALAFGWAPFWVFNIIVLFYVLAVATELGAKIFFFRRGLVT